MLVSLHDTTNKVSGNYLGTRARKERKYLMRTYSVSLIFPRFKSGHARVRHVTWKFHTSSLRVSIKRSRKGNACIVFF